MSRLVIIDKDLGRVDYSELNGHLDRFKNLLSKWKNDKQELNKILRPSHDISLFYNAVKTSPDFAAYLIQFAIENDVDSRHLLGSVYGNSPLHAAIEKRNYQLLEMILKYAAGRGRYASLFDTKGYHGTPFQTAMRIDDIRSMNIIFRFGLENGMDAVKLLGLEKGKQTALHYAIDNRCCLEVMRAIVTLARDNGVDVKLLFRADVSGMTPLHFASCNSSKMVDSVIELAKECGISAQILTCRDRSGNSPLHYAAKESDEVSVKAIWNLAIDSGVDVTNLCKPNDVKRTPLHCAATNTSHNTFGAVLWRATCYGVPLHLLFEGDSYGRTPLHLLANNQTTTTVNYGETVRYALRLAHEGSQLPAILKRDRQGRTPLDYAAIRGNKYIARAILQSTAQLDQEMVHVLFSSNTGQTPLHFAAENGKDNAARVVMQAAAESGRETAKTLLATDKCGNTPLKLALESSSDSICTVASIIRFSLDVGVDWKTLIDIQDAAHRSKLKEIFYKQIICEPRIWPRLYPPQSR